MNGDGPNVRLGQQRGHVPDDFVRSAARPRQHEPQALFRRGDDRQAVRPGFFKEIFELIHRRSAHEIPPEKLYEAQDALAIDYVEQIYMGAGQIASPCR